LPLCFSSSRIARIIDRQNVYYKIYSSIALAIIKREIMSLVPMTEQGAVALREEVEHLKTVLRPRIVNDIALAREHGDLKENAEYHAAREEQGFCEGRIKEIDGKLSNAQVIDVTKIPNHGRVIFGSTVTALDLDTEIEVTYHIVGEDEADIKQNRISVSSPIARAFIGKSLDDEVQVTTPGGVKEFEISRVDYV